MEKPCEVCGTPFYFKPSAAGRARFCSQRCLGISNGARVRATGSGFKKGSVPWAKLHAKGRRLSPRTEFKAGTRPVNWLPVGSVRIRDDKNGAPRAFAKVAEPNAWKLRAVVVWEATHGPLPKGKLVHHRDRDSLNDVPSNLQALTRQEHVEEHQNDLIHQRREARSRRTATA